MTKQKTILIVMVVSLVFNAAFLGGLAYRLHDKSKHSESIFERRFVREGRPGKERLELSPELRESLRHIHEEFSPVIRDIRDRLRKERHDLLELLVVEDSDSLAIEEKLRRIGKFQLEIEREVVHRLFREKEMLPLEQRRQFLEMMTRRWGDSPRPRREKHKRMRRVEPVEEDERNE